MSNVDSQLLPGETVIYRTKLHWQVFLFPGFFAGILFLVSLGQFTSGHGMCYLILAGFLILGPILKRANSEFVITNTRVIAKKRGLLTTSSAELLLWKVEAIQVYRGPLGKLLGYGDIMVRGSGSTLVFRAVESPLELRHALESAAAPGTSGKQVNAANIPGTSGDQPHAVAGQIRRGEEENEKPIYQRWWVLVIAIIVVLLAYRLITVTGRPAAPSQALPQGDQKYQLTLDTLKEMDKRLDGLRAGFNKYYATMKDMEDIEHDINLLTAAQGLDINKMSAAQKRLYSKTAALLPKAQEILREACASHLEESFVKAGKDVQVSAVGEGKKMLRIANAEMSRPLIYKFQNEIKIDKLAKSAGFSGVVYTNGLESSLNKTWTVSLK